MSDIPPTEKSKAQLLAEHINKKLEENADLNTLEGRKKDFAEFLLENKPTTFTKSHYLDILKRELKRKNIDAKAYGLSSKSPTFIRKTSDMKVNLTAHPSKVEQKNPPDPKNKIETAQIKKPDGTPASQEEIKQLISDYRINFNEQNVAITIKALYNVLKLRYPDIEGLTDDEKEILGQLWLPAFQKYLAESYAIIVIPAISTLAIISPKINEAKKKSKKWNEKELDNEIKKLQKKKDEIKK